MFASADIGDKSSVRTPSRVGSDVRANGMSAGWIEPSGDRIRIWISMGELDLRLQNPLC